MKRLPWKVRDFHVVGGGCFGSHYVRQLLKARDYNHLEFRNIKVIDHNPHCALTRSDLLQAGQVSLVLADWEDYLSDFLQKNLNQSETALDHWVPSPLSPHLLFLAFLRAAKLSFEILDLGKSFKNKGPEIHLAPPVKIPLASGSLALSFAKWKCPVHCIEPKFCPGIEDFRDWEMALALKKESQVLVCRHRLQGVGTIAMAEILEEFQNLLKSLEDPQYQIFKLATLSTCHGVLGEARLLR
ncbi:MAG: hypothetical protein KDK66_03820 [Deltaproteobacteria bacterium]|nr:hypothetical protein [Deltaproteobacteria bacterium]